MTVAIRMESVDFQCGEAIHNNALSSMTDITENYEDIIMDLRVIDSADIYSIKHELIRLPLIAIKRYNFLSTPISADP